MDLPTMHATLARLAAKRGRPRFWRSVEEASGLDPAAAAPVATPGSADELAVQRRGLLKVMGASVAVGGLAACTKQHPEKIVPYVDAPEEIIPGKPLFFATAADFNGTAIGLLAESHMGRPVKIEGNPRHPASLGGTDAIQQAAVMDLYDPDRSQQVLFNRRPSDWTTFSKAVAGILDSQAASGGSGIRLLVEPSSSPLLNDRLAAVLRKLPNARVHYFESVGRDNARAGAKLAFGKVLSAVPRFAEADVVLGLDSDFTGWSDGHLSHARDFASRRRASSDGVKLSRFYSIDCGITATSSLADHRAAVKPSRVAVLARVIAAELGLPVGAVPALTEDERKFVSLAVEDLKAAQGKALVVAGESQPAYVHALAHAINGKLGAIGRTVSLLPPVGPALDSAAASLADLVKDLNAGAVELLVCINVNPVFAAPGDLKFGEALAKAKTSVHLGLHADETAERSNWHIPGTHFLEQWGDAAAFDGTASIQQPLILPLYHGRSALDLISLFNGDAGTPAHDLLKSFWKARHGNDATFEKAWRKSLHDGLVENTAAKPETVTVDGAFLTAAPAEPAEGLEIAFRPDPMVWDGRFANNGWLQEAPRPVTTIVWDNAALVSIATARKLSLAAGILSRDRTYPKNRMVMVEVNGQKLEVPFLVVPGQADDCITLHIGQGRTAGTRVSSRLEDPNAEQGPIGFNVNPLRKAGSPWHAAGAKATLTARTHSLALIQDHFSQENRHLFRSVTKAEFAHDPHHVGHLSHKAEHHVTMYGNQWDHVYATGYQWAMVIDLSTCNGCNACVTACQAENNTAVVGKYASLNGREMHWLRVDRYFEGDPEHASASEFKVGFQPVPCMQCENAPCETVCPVGATTHSNDGLNQMVYNRCVGTRYCANNCPYKVRRFNLYKFSDMESESLKLLRNPDVTVRARGVMEKCTYCVQRINHARINSKLQGREIRDGEIVTACQQACPTASITFGNKRDPNSRVSKLQKSLLNYTLLDELNTRPRTSYLANVTNPNAKAGPAASHGGEAKAKESASHGGEHR